MKLYMALLLASSVVFGANFKVKQFMDVDISNRPIKTIRITSLKNGIIIKDISVNRGSCTNSFNIAQSYMQSSRNLPKMGQEIYAGVEEGYWKKNQDKILSILAEKRIKDIGIEPFSMEYVREIVNDEIKKTQDEIASSMQIDSAAQTYTYKNKLQELQQNFNEEEIQTLQQELEELQKQADQLMQERSKTNDMKIISKIDNKYSTIKWNISMNMGKIDKLKKRQEDIAFYKQQIADIEAANSNVKVKISQEEIENAVQYYYNYFSAIQQELLKELSSKEPKVLKFANKYCDATSLYDDIKFQKALGESQYNICKESNLSKSAKESCRLYFEGHGHYGADIGVSIGSKLACGGTTKDKLINIRNDNEKLEYIFSREGERGYINYAQKLGVKFKTIKKEDTGVARGKYVGEESVWNIFSKQGEPVKRPKGLPPLYHIYQKVISLPSKDSPKVTKKLNYGQSFDVSTAASCEVLELSITSNSGKENFKF